MRSLPKPDVTSAEVLQLCAASIRDPDLKERLLQAEAVVEAAEELYREHGESAELHAIKGTKTVGGLISRKEMERVYNGTFVKSSQDTQHIRQAQEGLRQRHLPAMRSGNGSPA